MKTALQVIITVCALLSCLILNAQIPNFKSNVPEEVELSSPVYKKFAGDYDFIIAYCNLSYWSGNIMNYSILAYKDNEWFKIKFAATKKNDKWSKPKMITKPFNGYFARRLIDSLNRLSFWSMSQDSLNIDEREIDDNKLEKFDISDGTSYNFELLSSKAFSIIYAYAPEFYLSKLPEITIRKRFLHCLNLFFNAYNSKN